MRGLVVRDLCRWCGEWETRRQGCRSCRDEDEDVGQRRPAWRRRGEWEQ